MRGIRGGVVDGDDELAGWDRDFYLARELDGQAVVVGAVFAVAETLGINVGEQGQDALLVVLGWQGPGGAAGVEEDGEGGVRVAVGCC